jgi:hypothetical protein
MKIISSTYHPIQLLFLIPGGGSLIGHIYHNANYNGQKNKETDNKYFTVFVHFFEI